MKFKYFKNKLNYFINNELIFRYIKINISRHRKLTYKYTYMPRFKNKLKNRRILKRITKFII